MAWLEWHQQVLPSNWDDTTMDVSLSAPDTVGPGQNWRLQIDHQVSDPPPPDGRRYCRAISVTLETLGHAVSDWRDLGYLKIHAVPAWHVRTERVAAVGSYDTTCLKAVDYDFTDEDNQRVDYWLADHFRVSFSPPIGYRFPCEIEAWLMPAEQARGHGPLTGAEIDRIPDGPPNLRIMASVRLASAQVTVEAGQRDPVATARRRLQRRLKLDPPGDAHLRWWSEAQRSLANLKGPVPEHDRRCSDVRFILPE